MITQSKQAIKYCTFCISYSKFHRLNYRIGKQCFITLLYYKILIWSNKSISKYQEGGLDKLLPHKKCMLWKIRKPQRNNRKAVRRHGGKTHFPNPNFIKISSLPLESMWSTELSPPVISLSFCMRLGICGSAGGGACGAGGLSAGGNVGLGGALYLEAATGWATLPS